MSLCDDPLTGRWEGRGRGQDHLLRQRSILTRFVYRALFYFRCFLSYCFLWYIVSLFYYFCSFLYFNLIVYHFYGNGRSWQDSCTALFFIFGVFFLTVFFYIQLFSFIYFVVFFILIWLFIISTATADPDKIRVPRSFLFSVFSFLLFSFIYNYFLLFIL